MSSTLNGDTARSDLALLELWRKERDADSFAEIVTRHSPMVYSTCCRILKDPAEAEDISQECFLKLASSRGRLDRSLGSWLHVVATRLCLNQIESRKHRRERERLSAERAKCVEDRRHWDDISEAVDEAIAGLPEKLRDPIIGRFFEGRTYQAIAGSLGIPRPTVAKRVQKGIEAIRSSLRRKGVLVTSTALALFLGQQKAQAVPRFLARELGKIALAGSTGSTRTLSTIGEVLLMTSSKKLGLTAFLAALIMLALVLIVPSSLYRRQQSSEEMVPEPAAKVATVAGAPREANDHGESRSPPKRAEERPAAAKVSQESRAIKPASISGRVQNQQDEPMVAAQVEVEVCKDATGIQVLKTFTAETDGDGMYEVSGIDVFGSTHVYVAAEGYSTGRAERDLIPGLDLVGINIILRKAVTAVEGWVFSRAMEPLPGASVRIRYYGYVEESLDVTAKTGGSQGWISDSPWTSARTDQDGHFSIPLNSDGLCDFTVIKEGFAAGFFPKIPAGTNDAQFVLLEYSALEGKVTSEDGSPAGNVQVEITGYALPGGLKPSEVPVQSFRLAPISVKSDESGAYQAKGLSADYWYDISAREEGNDGTVWIARIEALSLEEGQVTRDVDLVLVSLQALPPAIVRGRVTYAGTSLPAHPLGVFASLDGESKRCSDIVNTNQDGFYELKAEVVEKTLLRILWLDRNSGGYAPLKKGVEFPTLIVSPGREQKLDFTVGHIPFSICIRFVDRDRKPLENIAAGMQVIRYDRPCGEQGSNVKSDSDGRAVWEGLSPGETYEAIGFGKGGIVGRSRRFTGHPGEAEIEIVCVSRTAGLRGIVLDVDGKPLDKDIVCSAPVSEGVNLYGKDVCVRTYNTEADGTFFLQEGMPEGRHQKVVVRRVENRDESGQEKEAVIKMVAVEDIDLLPGEILDLGTIALRQVSLEEAERILGTPDPWIIFERYRLFGHP